MESSLDLGYGGGVEAIFAATFLKAVIMAVFARVMGREMFPANPKGPLYKWFGGANRRGGS